MTKIVNFKIGDTARISKWKNIFAKGYVPDWSEKVFFITIIKNTVRWAYIINSLKEEEILGTFYKKEQQKSKKKKKKIKKSLQLEKQ